MILSQSFLGGLHILTNATLFLFQVVDCTTSMAPNVVSTTLPEEHHDPQQESKPLEPVQIVWRNVLLFIVLHAAAVYGMYVVILNATLTAWLYGEFTSSPSGTIVMERAVSFRPILDLV
ncbi:acyl-CoA desaturase [Caerostris extrusa]|uniref:Acyl-CoA desaturase n=1 Tax=Caerostris extrusa TaxID=172846 RepID=A0AAV4V7K5_CAEEX|nr:acyl-CoA desaturase [Caerostris extrusa]